MAILQFFITVNYGRRIIGLLPVNCIFIRYFLTLDPTQTDGWTSCDGDGIVRDVCSNAINKLRRLTMKTDADEDRDVAS